MTDSEGLPALGGSTQPEPGGPQVHLFLSTYFSRV